MKSQEDWSEKSPLETQRAERRPVPELAAYHWSRSGLKQDGVKDISATGVYLLTEERWQPGASVSLTLQRKGPPEKIAERQIKLKMTAVRWGEDGVGLSFVLPKDLELRLWENSLYSQSDANLTDPEFILREFRMADALAFLGRICPPAAEEVRRLLRDGLSNYRAESAVEIALKAENLLECGPDTDRMRVPPGLVMRILEDGSWADDDRGRQLWAGLLATSCTDEGEDESNLVLVNLLSQLAPIHILIFTAACRRATKVVSGSGWTTSKLRACATDEIMKITRSRDIIRIECDLEYLTDLGLLEKRVKSAFFSPVDDASITPTSLGLQLYARCHGHRGAPQEFYGAVSPSPLIFAKEQ